MSDERIGNAAPDENSDGEPDYGSDLAAVSTTREKRGAGLLPFLTVGIGASAGGVEAYIELFTHLPSDTGMAFVVISHLQANQPSYLREILARHTTMRTTNIETGMRPQPNRLHLLPPNARVRMQGGRFHLDPREFDGMPRTIDYFFQSLAADQRNHSVGIVLSGMDSDGVAGLRAIKGEGGISIVQSPESARFPDMPRSSISGDHVDMILPPAQIASQLAEVGRRFNNPELRALGEGAAPAGDDSNFATILGLLRTVGGVDFRLYKTTTIRRRIARRMLMRRMDTLAGYVSFLQGNPQEIRELHEDALINVTRFFRDSEVFDALKNLVFPEILKDRASDRQIRIWVAGCSSGEEVYSIAICLLEFLTGSPFEPPIQIFGTDASEANIKKARVGIYPETISAEVSPERLRRFFVRSDGGYQVTKRIRDLCIFARQNLCHDPPFSRLDLISCRNVLIYFGPQLQKQLIPTFHYALNPNGFLLLGASETIREFTDLFALVERKQRIYERIGNTPSRALLEMTPRIYFTDTAATPPENYSNEPLSDIELQRAADLIVLARYGPPGVIINEAMEILQSRGHTGPFFEMAQGAASFHLLRMVHESIASEIAAAVRRAISEDIPIQIQGIQLQSDETERNLTLEVLPVHGLRSQRKCYLVLFVSTQEQTQESLRTREILPEDEDSKDRLIVQMRHDLSSTRLYLQSLLEERDVKNQELISANEEIQSANEELQSTNEELETTKEELQSSNEELQTVNDELQNRNAILTRASNDLSNLLNSVNLPVLMLSSEFYIRHFTPQMQRLMNLRATDIGRPFRDITLNLDVENLEPLFTEVLDTLAAREIEVRDREGHWYLLRVRPYRTTDNKIEGLVIVLVDIDQLRRSQQELSNARDFAGSIIESIPLPLVVVDSDFKIRYTNHAFSSLTRLSRQELELRLLTDLAAVLWGMERPLHSMLDGLRNASDAGAAQFDFEHKTSVDEPKVFLLRGRPLKPDGEQFLLITFEDITSHKAVERLLTVEGERLASEVASTAKELGRSQGELRGLTGNLLTSQEEERRRVARELHDDFSQRLAAVEMEAVEISRHIAGDPAAAQNQLEQLRIEVVQLADDMRRMSHQLHPAMLEDLGLASALRSLTEDFGAREGMIATFLGQDVPEQIPIEITTVLYRLAQEALHNVSKHAGKTHVKVIVRGTEGGLEMQIADSGHGFDPDGIRTGLGFVSMEERTRLIGATLKIDSALGEGTKVTVCVPLSDNSDH